MVGVDSKVNDKPRSLLREFLSPILFLKYMNDMLNLPPREKRGNISAFANDRCTAFAC